MPRVKALNVTSIVQEAVDAKSALEAIANDVETWMLADFEDVAG